MTTKLDLGPARPLTRREIAKVIAGAVGALILERVAEPHEVHEALQFLRDIFLRGRDPREVHAELVAEGSLRAWPIRNENPGWRALLGGVVGSFTADGWCSKQAVDDAITWTLERWPEIMTALEAKGQA